MISGRALRWSRVKRGWTQQDLAEKMGVTRNTILAWENDMSQIATVVAIACYAAKRKTDLIFRQVLGLLAPLGGTKAAACVLEVLPHATESPAGYIYGALKKGRMPSKKSLAWAETVVSMGMTLLDDKAEVSAHIQAVKRLTGYSIAPERVDAFRKDFCAEINRFVAYNAQGAIDFSKQV